MRPLTFNLELLSGSAAGRSRTGDLAVTSPAHYRYITKPPRAKVDKRIVTSTLSHSSVTNASSAHLELFPRPRASSECKVYTQLRYMGERPKFPQAAVTFPEVRLVPNCSVW